MRAKREYFARQVLAEWRQVIIPRRWLQFSRLHGVTFQMKLVLTVAVVFLVLQNKSVSIQFDAYYGRRSQT